MHMKSNGISTLEAENLVAQHSIRHAFFTRKGGVSDGIYDSLNVGLGSDDKMENVHENRKRAMAAMDMPAKALHTMHQVHGADVIQVNSNAWEPAQAPKADALVTNSRGVVLGVLTADCVPVLFADPSAGIVAAAHSGWRGTVVGVLAAAVEAMEGLGANRRNIYAAVGPAIAQESYEVGPEFPAPFLKRDAENARFFRPSVRDGHHMFDLTGCVVSLLEDLSLASIDHLAMDTCAEDARFFSYRRSTHRGEPDYGRGLSAISLGD
jgi:YfiH family protein